MLQNMKLGDNIKNTGTLLALIVFFAAICAALSVDNNMQIEKAGSSAPGAAKIGGESYLITPEHTPQAASPRQANPIKKLFN